jgi:hypothetical protein
MRKIFILLIALGCFVAANAQKNYPILTLEEIGAVTIIHDEVIMIVVENVGEVPNLAFYDLEKKALMQKFSAKLPENPVAHIIPCDNGLLYLVTIKKNPEDGPPLFDAIYSFDHKKDKIKLVYTEKDNVIAPQTAAAVHLKLVLDTEGKKGQPHIFNIESGAYETFSTDENVRMLCASNKHISYVVLKINEFGDDDTVPVYVMDKNGQLSETVGIFDSRMRASTNKEENHMPGFTITNPEYNWIPSAYDYSGFPLSGFSIAMHPGLAEKYNQTANLFDIREIVTANETYMAAKGNYQLWVYNTLTPNTTKPKTVSDEDRTAINAWIDNRTEYIKQPIQSAALEQVFDAGFYLVTEKTDLGDNAYSESDFIAFSYKGKYDVMLNVSTLAGMIKPEFKLDNEEKAARFQDALNALYPPGTFDKKHIQCYKKDNAWYFIRGESFGKKKGFLVSVDSTGKIEKIEEKSEID